MTIRILVVDDHGILRAGLIALLNAQPDMEVVGEAENGNAALALTIETNPDIVLMDISMPDMDGVAATKNIKQLNNGARVIILSVHEDSELVKEAINCGAHGYILKKALKANLIHAIHEVMRNEIYLHASLAQHLFKNKPYIETTENKLEVDPLTPREVDVLRFIAKGYTNKQTAKHLKISVRTVEYHRSHITEKLNLYTRVELMQYAEKEGIV